MAHNRPQFWPYQVTDQTAERPPYGFRPRFEESQDITQRLRRIERIDQELAACEDALTTSHLRLRLALVQNAHATASIEGNPMSLQDVRSLLERAPSIVDVEADEREILNWVAFMDRLDDHPFPVDVAGVRRLHGALMDGVLDDAGTLKDGQNFIANGVGEVVFVPSPAEAVPGELQAALDWLHASALPPVVAASLFFMEYQGIHPFRDGNGRTGRALFTWYLHNQGYRGIRYALVDAAFNADRAPYYQTLYEVERNGYDYTPWVRYIVGIVEAAYEDALQGMLLERDHPGLNERQASILTWLRRIEVTHPARRVKLADVHAALPHVPLRTLQRDLAGLVADGLVDRDGDRKAATYQSGRVSTP